MEQLIEDPRWNYPLSYWKQHSPSRMDGVSFEQELGTQSKGVEYITRLASLLRLPAQTVFASSLFLHRYYSRFSVKQTHPYETSASCVFLACKTEESPRKLRDVAAAILIVSQKVNKSIKAVQDENSPMFEQWQKVILQRESELLETLMFDFANTAPYNFLNDLVAQYVPHDLQASVGPKAVSFINDSCRTLLSVEVGPDNLAVVALYWASKTTKTHFIEENGQKWYAPYLSREKIVQYINDMSEMMKVVRGNSQDGQQYARLT